MQPLQSFAMAHVDDVQVRIPNQAERVICGHSCLFGICRAQHIPKKIGVACLMPGTNYYF